VLSVIRTIAIASVAGVLGAPPATAQCVLDGVGAVSFGSYDPFANAPLDTTGSVTYKCLVSLTITIDLGTGASASYAVRTLKKSGGASLNYNLYLDATRLAVWGNAAGNGTVHYGPVVGLLTDVTIPIFARIPARQDAAVGSYSDTVVVTLNY